MFVFGFVLDFDLWVFLSRVLTQFNFVKRYRATVWRIDYYEVETGRQVGRQKSKWFNIV